MRESVVRAFMLLLVFAASANAQDMNEDTSAIIPSLPEQIVITGERPLVELRTRMQEAEVAAYNIFNALNDEDRFDISCSMQQPAGTRIERQVCAPNFQLEAARTHAMDYFETTRDALGQSGRPIGSPGGQSQPVAALIASQQEAYRRKLREIAEQHPEFLDAIVEYGALRERYETAIGRGTDE